MIAATAEAFAKPPSPGKIVSMVLAVSVHLLLLAFLFYGIRWQTQKPVAIEVELVQAEPAVVESLPAQTEPEPRPAPVAQPEPRHEEKPLPPPPKPDIALKEKPKPAPKPAVKPPSDLFDKQLDQELKQTASRKAEELASAAAARELSQLKASQLAAARNKAIADYIGKIRGKIKGNIVLPPDLKGNPEAVFDVVQLPSGEILSAKLKKSSGHAGYDAAVERAILKSSPLPKPEWGDLFNRELELRFRPLEE